MALNQYNAIGNLTRDPELRYTKEGRPVADFGFAVNDDRGKKDGHEPEPLFWDVTIFGDNALHVTKFLTKGRQVCVVARIKVDRWNDKTTGDKRQKLHLIAQHVEFLGSPPV